MPRSKFVIKYKSGNEIYVMAQWIRVVWNNDDNTIQEFAWEDMSPEPIMMGVTNIEAVWKVK